MQTPGYSYLAAVPVTFLVLLGAAVGTALLALPHQDEQFMAVAFGALVALVMAVPLTYWLFEQLLGRLPWLSVVCVVAAMVACALATWEVLSVDSHISTTELISMPLSKPLRESTRDHPLLAILSLPLLALYVFMDVVMLVMGLALWVMRMGVIGCGPPAAFLLGLAAASLIRRCIPARDVQKRA